MFLKMRLAGLNRVDETARGMIAVADEYAALYAQYTGRALDEATLFEIGYGQRPARLMVLTSLGFAARGIDLDRPMIGRSLSALVDVARHNGPARAIKSAVRHYIFDGIEQRGLDRALRERDRRLVAKKDAFLVGDVAALDLPDSSIDFIYSEDVFEHIPPDAMEATLQRIARWLTPDGIASLTPCVYPSLPGSHLPEWYPHTLANQTATRRSMPWEHLRDRRFRADCYLNELKLRDYRQMFARHLEIVDEIDMDEGIGRRYLTDGLRAQFGDFEEKELVGSRFRFILKRRTDAGAV